MAQTPTDNVYFGMRMRVLAKYVTLVIIRIKINNFEFDLSTNFNACYNHGDNNRV